MKIKKTLSIAINFAVFILSFLGAFLACVFAQKDGYSAWYKRLYYFTQQSNLWIGSICLLVAIVKVNSLIERPQKNEDALYLVKYVFTVSITVTGIIFCTLLAPFANFDVWTFSSVITHVVVPILAIFDFFMCDNGKPLNKKCVYFALIPPLIYFVFAGTFSAFGVDFGRGDPFPYFFMNFNSEVGMFGFMMKDGLPQLGTFYWIIILFSIIFGIACLYYALSPTRLKQKRNK